MGSAPALKRVSGSGDGIMGAVLNTGPGGRPTCLVQIDWSQQLLNGLPIHGHPCPRMINPFPVKTLKPGNISTSEPGWSARTKSRRGSTNLDKREIYFNLLSPQSLMRRLHVYTNTACRSANSESQTATLCCLFLKICQIIVKVSAAGLDEAALIPSDVSLHYLQTSLFTNFTQEYYLYYSYFRWVSREILYVSGLFCCECYRCSGNNI